MRPPSGNTTGKFVVATTMTGALTPSRVPQRKSRVRRNAGRHDRLASRTRRNGITSGALPCAQHLPRRRSTHHRGRITAPRAGEHHAAVLFLVSAHNGLSQRVQIALEQLGHHVTVAVVDGAAEMEAAVAEHDPELIVCPFLKKLIPESIWAERRCLIVHPGPSGDRGPSSLDWAIKLGASGMGSDRSRSQQRGRRRRPGPGHPHVRRPGRRAGHMKPLPPRGQAWRRGGGRANVCPDHQRRRWPGQLSSEPEPAAPLTGQARPLMTQQVRAIDWESDPTATVAAQDPRRRGPAGALLDAIGGIAPFTCSAPTASGDCAGRPGGSWPSATGRSAAPRSTAPCGSPISSRADTAEPADVSKLPAAQSPRHRPVPGPPPPAGGRCPPHATTPRRSHLSRDRRGPRYTPGSATCRFEFYNGAMSTDHCRRLREAFIHVPDRSRTQGHRPDGRGRTTSPTGSIST